jgi:DNA-binding transcriptional LysR family regulator
MLRSPTGWRWAARALSGRALYAAAAVLDLRLLRYFVAVAETEHVGKAAAKLHISQSPLSRQIRQLEELLGIQLFERERRRIRLTSAGRWLLAPAREMLARADLLVRDAHEARDGQAGRIALGFVSAALSTGVLPAALRRLRRERPKVKIALRQGSSNDQLVALQAGELDLAIVHRAPRAGELEVHALHDQPYVLAVPRPGPLVRGRITPTRLAGQPWIGVRSTEVEKERIAKLAPNIVTEVVDWVSALALVDAGVGLAIVPTSYAKAPPANVAIRPLPWLAMSSPLWLVRRRGLTSLLTSVVAGWLLEAGRR